jgi:hypothetical protein
MEVEGISVLPWGNSAAVTVVERISNIRGDLLQEKRPANAAQNATFPPPEWEGGRYVLKYRLSSNRWFITEIRLLDSSPTGTPRPTPNMSLSPMPAVTNTPSVTPTPSITPSMAPSPTPSASGTPEETPEETPEDDNA